MPESRLPPLNALRAFEAAARHGGFIGASEELHVTRGAISRQVKVLEEHLGLELFVRQPQGVRLTAAGQRLLPILTKAFGDIRRETAQLTREANEVHVICPPATSIRWLLPRLSDFRDRHPEIRLRLTTDFFRTVGFDPADYDIGFSVADWPRQSSDLTVETLFPVLMTPACSPAYLARNPLRSPGDLSRCELLHETANRADWTAWTEAFSPSGIERATHQDFPNLDMATKAAIMGAGVVMADLVLCRDELDGGALVAPFPDLICPSPFGGICLIGERERWSTPKVTAFRTWVMERSESDRQDLAARYGGVSDLSWP